MKDREPAANIHGDEMSIGEDSIPQDMLPVLDEPSHELLKGQVERVLASLSPRERSVGELRLGLRDGIAMTQVETARVLGVSRRTVGRVEASFFKKLRHPSSR